MMRTVLLGLVLSAMFVGVAPYAAATHVPICWSLPPDWIDVTWVEGNPVCAVDCTWDVFTGLQIKRLAYCLRYVTG